MAKHGLNTALKTAVFDTGQHQERIAKAARIQPQKLSHVIHGRRELDEKERARLLAVLARYGVHRTESELFSLVEEVA